MRRSVSWALRRARRLFMSLQGSCKQFLMTECEPPPPYKAMKPIRFPGQSCCANEAQPYHRAQLQPNRSYSSGQATGDIPRLLQEMVFTMCSAYYGQFGTLKMSRTRLLEVSVEERGSWVDAQASARPQRVSAAGRSSFLAASRMMNILRPVTICIEAALARHSVWSPGHRTRYDGLSRIRSDVLAAVASHSLTSLQPCSC